MPSAAISTQDYFLLPGRLRIAVPGLRRNAPLAQSLTARLQSSPGILSVSANPLTGRALIRFDPKQSSLSAIQREIAAICRPAADKQPPAVSELAATAGDPAAPAALYALATGGVLAGLIAKQTVIGRSPRTMSPQLFNLAAVATLLSGYPILKSGLVALARDKRLNPDLVLFAATLALLAMRESITGLSVLWLVHLSRLFQHAVQLRSRTAVRKLLQAKQPAVRRLTDYGVDSVAATVIQPGDIIVVQANETAAVDGTVVAGKAVVSPKSICGDCRPAAAGVNDRIAAGTLLLDGALKIRADTAGHDTTLTLLSRQAAELAKRRSLPRLPSDDHVGKLTWLALGVAGASFLLTRDSMRSLAVLLAGCPAAVALARHTAWGTSVAAGAGRGMLINDARRFEAAGQADTVIFDKTGTLTAAAPEIADIIVLQRQYSREKLLALAASAVRGTCHPWTRMLVDAARKQKLALQPAKIQQIRHDGIQAVVDSHHTVSVGNAAFLTQAAISLSRKAREQALAAAGAGSLFIAINGKAAAMLAIHDRLRPGCREAVRALRALRINDIGLLSGDQESVTAAAAAGLSLNRHWGGVPPAGKAGVIRQLRQQGKTVIMVGDGCNDAPAFAASDLGVVMGRAGASPAVAAADVALLSDEPRLVPELIALSRRTQTVIKQNVVLSVGLNAAGIALAAAKLISPVAAGLLLNLSTVAVIANSTRLLARAGKKRPTAFDLQRHSEAKAVPSRQTPALTLAAEPRRASPDVRNHEPLWLCSPQDLFACLGISDKNGLREDDARRRLQRYGPNLLQEGARPSFWHLFAAQFKDLMVQVLLGAAGISFALGKTGNALLTMAIVVGNAILGVVQEMRSEHAIDALRRLAAPQARVLRGGCVRRINAADLVPGDVILLEAGDRVPADARLIKTYSFEVEESSLTGETVPVKKSALFLAQETLAAADRKHIVYMGTCVTRGRATAVVIATGMATEMGKIASLIQHSKEEPTPLQRRLEELGKYLVYGCLAVSALVFLAGLLRGERLLAMLQTAASLAVAAIPEGMTGIVVIALAMGVQRMSKRNIIIRKLSAIETLGCATVICSDKTGTLTKNQMTVREIFTMSTPWQVTGEGYAPAGECIPCCRPQMQQAKPELEKVLLAGALCNNARLLQSKVPTADKVVPLRQHCASANASGWFIDGDPTEGALIVAAAKGGLSGQLLTSRFQRVRELPFESERRMMSVICAGDAAGPTLYAKGAPDSILAACSHYLAGTEPLPLTEIARARINQAAGDMAARALRVLACAYRPVAPAEIGAADEALETGLIFCGLTGMIDPPRPEVPAAIDKCRLAGVKVVMITGDHPGTACAIARETGIMRAGETALLGADIDTMTDSQLIAAAAATAVYARTSPQHKLRIIKALKANGYVVAMTGDGVNDAPAVKAADIGIAMGLAGTDVTKEAASMTLSDDNFATIVRAMEEGRSIYANIRKAIRYLLATNIGEVLLMLAAALLGIPLPLLPIQLLWINLVGDGFPAIALVNDPPAADIMAQPPRTADESVFADGLGRKVISRGLIIGGFSLLLYYWRLLRRGGIAAARTLTLAHLAIAQFIHIFDCRWEKQTGRVGLLSNPWLLAAVALSMAMVIGVIQLPGLQPMFGTVALTAGEWLLAIVLAALTPAADALLTRLTAGVELPACRQLLPENSRHD